MPQTFLEWYSRRTLEVRLQRLNDAALAVDEALLDLKRVAREELAAGSKASDKTTVWLTTPTLNV